MGSSDTVLARLLALGTAVALLDGIRLLREGRFRKLPPLLIFNIGMPLAGWLILSAADKPIPFYGLELPHLIGPDVDLAKFIKGWGGVGIVSVLNCGAIDDGCSLVGREDWLPGSLVVVFGEHCFDVVYHGETTGAFGVIPGQVDACVEITFPVFCEVVEFLDGVMEVVSVVVANVFDSEVVYYEGEQDGSPPVSPETWCAFALVVALFVEAFGKEFLRQDA